MSDLMILEEDGVIFDIVEEILNNKSVPGQLSTKLGDLFSQFGPSSSLPSNIDFRITMKRKTTRGGFNEGWFVEDGSEATVGTLISTLRLCGHKDLADKLEVQFNIADSTSSSTSLELGASTSTLSSTIELVARQRKHITKHMTKLMELTNLNAMLIASVVAEDLLSKNDEAELAAVLNVYERKKRFYEIMGNQPGSFPVLASTLKDLKQNAACLIFEEFLND